MNLTAAIQEALVAILCYDDTPGGARLVKSLVPPKHYDLYYRDIAEAASNYLDTYGKVAGDHTLDLVDVLKERQPDAAEIFTRIFQSLERTKEGLNREYVLKRATLFARHQRLKRGMTQAIDLLQQENEESILQAEQTLSASLEGSYDLFDPGTFISDPTKALAFLNVERAAFPTGIELLDKKGLGPSRGRLHLFAGLMGTGKSWWLVNLAKWALVNRLRVVYVTLELDEPEVAQRILQCLFSVGKRNQKHEYQRFESDELGRFVSMDVEALADRPYLSQPDIRKFLTGKIGELKHRPPLVVRQFPTSSLSVSELEGYLDSLEGAHGIVPDLLIVDYADLMSLDARNLRIDTGQLYKKLRGLAVARNIAVATATQINRAGKSTRLITDEHLSEDFSKAATCDVLLTYNQTMDEHELGLARLFVAKGRTDADKFTVLISQAYSLGQFCLDSVGMVTEYWKQVEKVEEEVTA